MTTEIPQVAAGRAVAGPDMEALRRFHRDCTWTGKVKAGAMGPGSAEMEAVGRGAFEWPMGGLWVIGEFEQDQFVGGEKAVTWNAHYVAGWNSAVGEYRAFIADSNGVLSMMRGEIVDGNFVLTSMPDPSGAEPPVRLRMTWIPETETTMTWRNEGSMNGEDWFLIEDYLCEITG